YQQRPGTSPRNAYSRNEAKRTKEGFERFKAGSYSQRALQRIPADRGNHTVRTVFGYNHIQLKCFFHVMMNVRKQASKKGVPQGLLHDILAPAFECTTRLVRTSFKRFTISRWIAKPVLREFAGNFQKACFYVAGSGAPIATTNNPCETFNKDLTRDYSGRTLLPLNTQAKKLLEMAAHRSELGGDFVTQAQPPSKLQSRTKRLQANNLLILEPVDRMSIRKLQST
ncbi:TPA: hypothetical protein N0F65_004173, partial [Lagenidium giganteum]